MKRKIITAVGYPKLNETLKSKNEYDVISSDLKNDKEIIEILEREKDVGFLIFCSDILVDYSVDEFVEIVKKLQNDINIILFDINSSNIKIKDEVNIKVYNDISIDSNELYKILNQEFDEKKREEKSKVICISGNGGVGKSTFSTTFAKNVENQKVLLIDFDLDENNIRTILKIKKKSKDDFEYKDKVISINKNLDVLCFLDMHFFDRKNINFFEVQELIDNFKNTYDLIIIDTSSKLENEYTKKVFYNADEIIFLVEPNILGIKKAKNMLEVFENDWKISNDKIKILINKAGIYQISDSIIEELFFDKKVIGKLKYNDVYNLIINRNKSNREIKKEYKKICKKIV